MKPDHKQLDFPQVHDMFGVMTVAKVVAPATLGYATTAPEPSVPPVSLAPATDKPAGDIIWVKSRKAFEKVLAANPVVLLNFTAAWCMPCQAAAPRLVTLAAELAGKVAVVKADVDVVGEFASAEPESKGGEGVSSVPLFRLFRSGKPKYVAQQTGAMSLAQLRAFVKQGV